MEAMNIDRNKKQSRRSVELSKPKPRYLRQKFYTARQGLRGSEVTPYIQCASSDIKNIGKNDFEQ